MSEIEFDSALLSFETYRDESQLPTLIHMIDLELSESYTIFTYRYFLQSWPELTFLALY